MNRMRILKYITIEMRDLNTEVSGLKYTPQSARVKQLISKLYRKLIDSRIDDNNLLSDTMEELSHAAAENVDQPAGRFAGYSVNADSEFQEILERFVTEMDAWDLSRTEDE